MDVSKDTMTRYLLGELAEEEQSAFEKAFFDDPRVFAEVAEAEHALIDDYVRDRLTHDVRARVEQVYLTDPRRRERVKFAEILVDRLDGAGPGGKPAIAAPARSGFLLRTWLETLLPASAALRWSLASLLAVAVVSGGIWYVNESVRSRDLAARIDAARLAQERLVREQQAKAAADRERGEQLAREASRPEETPPPAPDPGRPAPTFVTLALAVGPGVRGTGGSAPATLVIPQDAEEARFALTLDERGDDRYRVIIRRVGGAEILRRGDLTPAPGPGPAFTVAVPSRQLDAGDYLLTLQGARGTGEFDDLSQSLFQVQRQQPR